MRNVLTSALPIAAVCAFMAAAPAFAQDTVTGAPAGTAPVTVEGYGYAPGQPGYGYNGAYEPGNGYTPAPDYSGWGPLAPVGMIVGGIGALGADVVVAPTYAVQPHGGCGVIHDFNGRYTSVCGP